MNIKERIKSREVNARRVTKMVVYSVTATILAFIAFIVAVAIDSWYELELSLLWLSILFTVLFTVSLSAVYFVIYPSLLNLKRFSESEVRLRVLIVIGLLAVLILSARIWYEASWWAGIVTSDSSGWYAYPELSRMEIRDAYDLAFKKIALIGGFFFASVLLLLKVFKPGDPTKRR